MANAFCTAGMKVFVPSSELIISVVDNHIVRNYMARILNGETLNPVVLRSSGRIKDGNHRAAAYKKLGMQIPTINYE